MIRRSIAACRLPVRCGCCRTALYHIQHPNARPDREPDYLSGLLIGHELGSIARLHLHTHEHLPAVILIGSEALCAR